MADEHRSRRDRRSVGTVSVANVFQGFSKVSGLAMPNSAVTGSTSQTAATSSVNYTVCTGAQEMLNAVGLEQSLNMSIVSSVSVSEKLEFVNQLQLTVNTVSILIHAVHGEGRYTSTSMQLASGVTAPGTDDQLREFVAAYGDCFVSEMVKGGEYIATYTFYSQSTEQQNTIKTSIQGEGIGLWGSVDASLSAKVESLSKSTNQRVSFNQIITGLKTPTFPTNENAIDFALSFPSIKLTSPFIISFKTTGYEAVPGITRKFDPVMINREKLAGGTKDSTNSFRGMFLRVSQLQKAVAQIQRIHTFYKVDSQVMDSLLPSVGRQAEADLESMKALVMSYHDDPLVSINIPNVNQLQSLSHGMPVLAIRRRVEGITFGTSGHTAFDDVGDPWAFVEQFTRITSIQLRSEGSMVDNLAVTYTSGGVEGTPTSQIMVNHGRPTYGRPLPELQVPRGHHVTGMRIAFQQFKVPILQGLKLTLSDRRSTQAGDFGSGSTLHDTQQPPPEDSFMLGFQGREGWYVDQVQLIYGTFISSTWEK